MPKHRKRLPPRIRKTEPKNGADPAAVVMEDLRAQMQIVIERSVESATKSEIRSLSALTEDVRQGNAQLQDALRQTRNELSAGFDGVQQVFHSLREDMSRQARAAELRALEQRVVLVERHLGL